MLVLCLVGRHAWKGEPPTRSCARCGQIESLRRDKYGDEHWEVEVRGDSPSLAPQLKRALGILAVVAVVAVIVLVRAMRPGACAPDPDAAPLRFANLDWTLKTGLSGPGPNCFAASGAFVDDTGRLHLKIDQQDGRWTTAEVVASRSFGYGRYSITFGTIPDNLKANIAIGFLTFDEAPEDSHREIDIELRQMQVESVAKTGAFTVQPWDQPGHTERFDFAPASGFTYSFEWAPDYVAFSVTDAENRPRYAWRYAGTNVPQPGNEKARLNLWLVDGQPPADGLPVEVVVERFAYEPPARLSFAGQYWVARASPGLVGPGPNYFSATAVRVDEQGKLHLTVAPTDGRWNSAEVFSERSFGYGTYRFTLETSVAALPPNLALGLFLYDEAPAQLHREMDIEVQSRPPAAGGLGAAFSVQPYDSPNHVFRLRPDGVTFSLEWTPDHVAFESRNAANQRLASWTYTGDGIPTPGNEKVRMNLWLLGGTPPPSGMPAEVVVNSFEFRPLGSP